MPIQLLTPRALAELAIVLVLALAGWYAYNWVYDRGAASVQAKWDKETLEEAQQSAKIASNALQITKSLQASADEERKIKNAQIAASNANTAAAIAGLSNRPSRTDTSSVPSNPASGASASGTGAGLFREDGEFLTREGARADNVRRDLIECQRLYNKARDAVK